VNSEFTHDGERERPDDAPGPTVEAEDTAEDLGDGRPRKRQAVMSIQGRLTEWHALDPETRERLWSDLVEWVAWLHDTYELGRESRLPECWPDHPGLVQELWALKCWREALYTTSAEDGVTTGEQAGSLAQHVRMWHNDMRMFVSEVRFYAPKCMSSHSRGPVVDNLPDNLRAIWHRADPLGGIPGPKKTDLPADTDPEATVSSESGVGATLYEGVISSALHAGQAIPHPAGLPGAVLMHEHWWVSDLESETWERVDDPRLAAQLHALAQHTGDLLDGL
jgi:hypothetical protein